MSGTIVTVSEATAGRTDVPQARPAASRTAPTQAIVPGPVPGAALPTPSPPATPIDVLSQIAAGSDSAHAVSVDVSAPRVRIGVDLLRFTLSSPCAGYVYVLMVGSDRRQFWLLFPNDIDKDNRVAAGATIELPRPGWRMTAAGPPDNDQLLAIVSETPRDFSAAGLKPNPPFSEFRLNEHGEVEGDVRNAAQRYVGAAHCPPQDRTCLRSDGAAAFSIEEATAP